MTLAKAEPLPTALARLRIFCFWRPIFKIAGLRLDAVRYTRLGLLVEANFPEMRQFTSWWCPSRPFRAP
jgi:hypothetical protein